MFLGALLDAGIPLKLFEDAVAGLNIGARLEISRVNRSGISATKVDICTVEGQDRPRLTGSEEKHARGRSTDTVTPMSTIIRMGVSIRTGQIAG